MMDLTPLEVRKKKGDFRRTMRGYDPALVDDFLDIVADRLDQLVRDNLSLTQQVARQDTQVAEFRDRERALTEALVTAQEMREEIRAQSAREAELALKAAEQETSQMRSSAEHEVTQMRAAAQQEALAVRSAAQQEAAALRQSASQEMLQMRTTAEQALQRAEESARNLRARQQQSLGTYRSFLERELSEVNVIAQTLDAAMAVATSTPAAPPRAPAPPTMDPAPVARPDAFSTSFASGGTAAANPDALAPAAAAGIGSLGLSIAPEPATQDEPDEFDDLGGDLDVFAAAAGTDADFEAAVEPFEPFEPEPFDPDAADEADEADDVLGDAWGTDEDEPAAAAGADTPGAAVLEQPVEWMLDESPSPEEETSPDEETSHETETSPETETWRAGEPSHEAGTPAQGEWRFDDAPAVEGLGYVDDPWASEMPPSAPEPDPVGDGDEPEELELLDLELLSFDEPAGGAEPERAAFEDPAVPIGLDGLTLTGEQAVDAPLDALSGARDALLSELLADDDDEETALLLRNAAAAGYRVPPEAELLLDDEVGEEEDAQPRPSQDGWLGGLLDDERGDA